MRRRALLAGLTAGTASLAGCTTGLFTDSTPPRVYNPTGRATIRPIDEPLVRHGLTSDSEQYLYGRLFLPGNSLPVTDAPNAAWLAEDVDDLSDGQFAVLTNLRTAGARPRTSGPPTRSGTTARSASNWNARRGRPTATPTR